MVSRVGGPGYINVEASEEHSPRQAWKQGCGWGAGGHGPVLQMWGDGKSPVNFTGTKSQGPEGSLGLCLPSLEEPLDRSSQSVLCVRITWRERWSKTNIVWLHPRGTGNQHP